MAAPLPKDAWKETDTRKPFNRESWMIDALCADHPRPQIFFPDRRQSHEYFSEARRVCAGCPVWKDCLNYAVVNHEDDGMWGGLSILERRLVKRSDVARKCVKCGLIRVFSQKAQNTCDVCKSTSSQKRSRRG